MASFLQFLRETGARAGEAHAMKWTDLDLDLEHGTVGVTAEKNSNARTLRLSPRLCGVLCSLSRNRDRVWGTASLHN